MSEQPYPSKYVKGPIKNPSGAELIRSYPDLYAAMKSELSASCGSCSSGGITRKYMNLALGRQKRAANKAMT